MDVAVIFIALVLAAVLVFVSMMHGEIVKIRKLMEILFVHEMVDDKHKQMIRDEFVEVMDE